MDSSHDRLPLQKLEARLASAVSTADAEAMVRLVSQVCDPSVDATIAERRSALCRDLAKLVDADFWIGVIGVAKEADPANAGAISVHDGGWVDERQRMEFFGICVNKELNKLINDFTAMAFKLRRTLTFVRSEAVSDDAWYTSPLSKILHTVGTDQLMVSIYPMEDYWHSIIGLHRRVGRPAFSDRDRTVAHIVWQQTEWLHRRDLDVPVGNKVVDLSVRERQVLLLLMGGDTRKAAAAKLGLSEHTVGDYIKGIYRKLGVKSRVELVANFLPRRLEQGKSCARP